MIAIAAAEPAPAAEITWARVTDDVAGGPHADGACPAGAVNCGEAGLVRGASQGLQQAVGAGKVAGLSEHRRTVDHRPVVELDAGQLVGLDHKPRDGIVHDLHVTSLQLDQLVGVSW